VKTLQIFLGFVNFYRRFIAGFAQTALPLTKLLKKDAAFDWNLTAKMLFDQPRDCLLREPVLKRHDPSLPTQIETDSSGYAVGDVLKQIHPDVWHPVAYLARTMTSAERSYPIQEQELLALIYALKTWIHYLFGMEVTACTYNFALATWETDRELSGRKACWIELLREFPLKIFYRKG
jgi:hypothetical protein